MSNVDDYYIKMTVVPQVTQQGVALNAFELADTKAEGINPLPMFTAQKRIEQADNSLKEGQLAVLSSFAASGSAQAQSAVAEPAKLSDNKRLLGLGFFAYLIYKFLK